MRDAHFNIDMSPTLQALPGATVNMSGWEILAHPKQFKGFGSSQAVTEESMRLNHPNAHDCPMGSQPSLNNGRGTTYKQPKQPQGVLLVPLQHRRFKETTLQIPAETKARAVNYPYSKIHFFRSSIH